jgi:hypothetical protein
MELWGQQVQAAPAISGRAGASAADVQDADVAVMPGHPLRHAAKSFGVSDGRPRIPVHERAPGLAPGRAGTARTAAWLRPPGIAS